MNKQSGRVWPGERGDAASVCGYSTMSKQPGSERSGQGGGHSECVWVHQYTTSKQSGNEYGQAKDEDAANVYGYMQTVREPCRCRPARG